MSDLVFYHSIPGYRKSPYPSNPRRYRLDHHLSRILRLWHLRTLGTNLYEQVSHHRCKYSLISHKTFMLFASRLISVCFIFAIVISPSSSISALLWNLLIQTLFGVAYCSSGFLLIRKHVLDRQNPTFNQLENDDL